MVLGSRRTGEQPWFLVHVVGLVESVAFVLVVVATIPTWHEINWFLGGIIGTRGNFIALVIIAWLGMIAFFTVTLVARARDVTISHHRAWRVASLMLLVAINGVYVLLVSLPAGLVSFVSRFIEGVWWLVLIVVTGGLLVLLVVKSRVLVRATRVILSRRPRDRRAVSGLLLLGTGCSIVLLLPFVSIPLTASDRPLPPRPLVIAHRGASHYAPENTIAAGEAAVAFGSPGWEIDVQVSLDGHFFLHHDDTFQRTTNVDVIFPRKADTLACEFTIDEIAQLDAGGWFVDDDPFMTIATGVVPVTTAASYRGQGVPTLAAALAFTVAHGLVVDVDFKRPPPAHPHASTATGALITMLVASGLGKRVWLSSSSPAAVNLTRMIRPVSVDSFVMEARDLINAGLGVSNTLLLEYLDHGIPVVVYTVDDIFTFSTLWVHGVTYIKSNRPWIFRELDAPVMFTGTVTHVWSWLAIHGIALVAAVTVARHGTR